MPEGTPESPSGLVAAPLLEVGGVDLAFGGIRALTEVTLQARRGEITAIIGPNGAGKTSLFNAVSGFYRPQRGQLRFGGRDITALPAHQRAALGLARTFQNVALFRGMSVLDNIKLGAHHRSSFGAVAAMAYVGPARRQELELRERLEHEVIDFLEIDHIRHHGVAGLPYGLQKRVELARALAMDPTLLMLDEPVAGMNREETEDMARFILDLQQERGMSVLLIEHDMGLVMDISDHVVVLNFGHVIARGTPEQVKRDPAVIEAYLGAQAVA